MGRLAPLSEEPNINDENEGGSSNNNNNNSKKGLQYSWRNWIKTHFPLVFNKKSNLKILLSVLACPLFPVPVHPKPPLNEASNPFSSSHSLSYLNSNAPCKRKWCDYALMLYFYRHK